MLTPEERDEVAQILETVAKEGLPGPRDLDVALDAIDEIYKAHKRDDDLDAKTNMERWQS